MPMRPLALLLLAGCQPLDLIVPCDVKGYQDDDRDGFGRTDAPSCTSGENIAPVGGDCDDTDPDIHPETPWYRDTDGDGFGDAGSVAHTGCEAPAGLLSDGTDCDDTDPAVSPGAAEDCSDRDLDCSGDPYDATGGVPPQWYADDDQDGYGDNPIGRGCVPVEGGTTTLGGDCDDDDPDRSPGVVEQCDGIDNDCSGLPDDNVPEADMTAWYADSDGDGYGDPADVQYDCDPLWGRVDNSDDCDDLDASTVGPADYPVDPDGDGYGAVGAETLRGCGPPEGTAQAYGDCLEGDASVHPDATEICDNGFDENCDGAAFPCAPEGTEALTDLDTRHVELPNRVNTLVAVGDVDGDGSTEFAVAADPGSGNQSVWFVDLIPSGDTTIGAIADELQDGPDSGLLGRIITSGDIDGDGYGDLVISAYRSRGGAVGVAFGPALPSGPVDGALDVWSVQTDLDDDQYGMGIAAGDFDGDGLDDVAVLTLRDQIRIFDDPLSQALSPEYASATLELDGSDTSSELLAPGDLTGDGIADLVYDEAPDIYLFEGPLDRDLTQGDVLAMLDDAALPGDVSTGTWCDQDGDGHLDAWSRHRGSDAATHGAVLHLGPVTSAGWATAEAARIQRGISTAGASTRSFAVAVGCGDFDGDGAADLMLADAGRSGTPQLFWFRDLGASGSFSPLDATATLEDATGTNLAERGMTHGDFDGDGVTDFAAASTPTSGDPGLLLLLGSGI